MKIYVKPDAADDLRKIKDYISKKLQNPIAAKNTLSKIKNTYSQLRDQPYIGTPLATKTDKDNDYRFLVSGNYIIIYKVLEIENTVEITRVFAGRQNYISDIFS